MSMIICVMEGICADIIDKCGDGYLDSRMCNGNIRINRSFPMKEKSRPYVKRVTNPYSDRESGCR